MYHAVKSCPTPTYTNDRPNMAKAYWSAFLRPNEQSVGESSPVASHDNTWTDMLPLLRPIQAQLTVYSRGAAPEAQRREFDKV